MINLETVLISIRNVFPAADVSVLEPDCRLDQIPGWDSMNSVNLTMDLQEVCGVDLFARDITLEGHETLNDLVMLLREAQPG